ncbi:ABC transporter permease [Plantactinospora siamensis]|uniref:ABC transporter permease n=1 Tax=Plantactinospora siamensis TaxID=555372 RepID=A0ABV6P0J1_9ACTN
MTDLLLGARLAVTGGRDGWTRTVLTALGVGIGVALLLLAAAVPGALSAHGARTDARDNTRFGEPIPRAANTLLVANVDTPFRNRSVRGRIFQAEGPDAPVPPGLTALPRPGEAVVSPALRRLLASPEGALFAPRLRGAKVVGTVGRDGLAGPGELVFYLGSDALTTDRASRVDSFGGGDSGEGLGPVLILLVAVVFVVLLLPIAVFLAAAVRFGSERRDRRLAALRLVGADAAMTRRIAAGEAAAAAGLGLLVGGALFALGRQLVPLVTLWDISVYASDVRPAPVLVAVIALAVPLVAVAASLVALRGVLVEPLGVTRRAGTGRRRLGWRLLPVAGGLALLYPLLGAIRDGDGRRAGYQVAAGAALLLIGTVTLLPWLVEAVVRPLRGGPVAWQLAVRRLQADSGGSARLVGGLAVAVAGVIGLQMLFAVAQTESTTRTGQDPSRATLEVEVEVPAASGARVVEDRLLGAPGVTGGTATLRVDARDATGPGDLLGLRVGDCAALSEFAVLPGCADGQVFAADGPPEQRAAPLELRPGQRLLVGQDVAWTVPAAVPHVPARADPAGWAETQLLVTPGAIDVGRIALIAGVSAFLRTDPADRDAIERLRNIAAELDRYDGGAVNQLSATREVGKFDSIRRGLYAGAVLTLLLIGASMLVAVLEQLRERRRLLAMLVAVGTRRSTLGWSVLWQAAVPVGLGLVLAVGFGLALGAILLRLVTVPFAVSWPVVGAAAGLAAGTVLLVTAGSLPALWRLTRPGGLRTE